MGMAVKKMSEREHIEGLLKKLPVVKRMRDGLPARGIAEVRLNCEARTLVYVVGLVGKGEDKKVFASDFKDNQDRIQQNAYKRSTFSFGEVLSYSPY